MWCVARVTCLVDYKSPFSCSMLLIWLREQSVSAHMYRYNLHYNKLHKPYLAKSQNFVNIMLENVLQKLVIDLAFI